jgi:hypothetical protein
MNKKKKREGMGYVKSQPLFNLKIKQKQEEKGRRRMGLERERKKKMKPFHEISAFSFFFFNPSC